MIPVFRLMCRQHGLIIGYHAIALAHNPILYLTQQVDEGRLREHVTRLATGERHSLYSPAHHAEAADYISTTFQGGLATRQHTFDIRGRSGMNIIYPQIRPFLEHNVAIQVASASSGLRSLRHGSRPPGADDNASGVAVLLECARVLSTVHLFMAVEFVAFDMEEKQPPNKVSLASSTALVNSPLRAYPRNKISETRISSQGEGGGVEAKLGE